MHVSAPRTGNCDMRITRRSWAISCLLALGMLLCWSLPAHAAVPDFYGRGIVAYDPVVDTVTSGTQVLVAPTVSHDRKYVTLGMSAEQSHVIRIENFPVVQVRGGWVGNPTPAPATSVPPDANASRPTAIGTAAGGAVLHQPGMTRVE